MLNIPESIKALYMTDGRTDIRKNFRVTFPNGENPDITNENILTESVKFTDSIMSQNVFRFGLAESPTISFETVGVPNILGMQIQCWHEIETSSLTAEQIAAIEAGTWDGKYIPEEDSDIGFGYFRIPLGVFTVESCPRSKGVMTHRQVKAIGRTIGTNEEALDAFTYWKLSQNYKNKNWTIGWDFLSPSVYGSDWNQAGKYYDTGTPSHIEDTMSLGIDVEEKTISFGTTGITSMTFPRQGGHDSNGNEYIPFRKKMKYLESSRAIGEGTLFYLHRWANYVREDLYNWVDVSIATIQNNIDWTVSRLSDGTVLGSKDACLNYLVDYLMEFYTPTVVINSTPDIYANRKVFSVEYSGTSVDTIIDLTLPNSTNWEILLPYGFSTFSYSVYWEASQHTSRRDVHETVPDYYEADIYKLTLKSAYTADFPTLKLPTTLKTKVSGETWYGYFNSFSFRELLTGFLETNGVFGKIKRNGSIEIYAITTTAAEALAQSDVKELWWDESNVLPVGSVNVKFKETETSNELSEATITIGKGKSVYNMTNNAMLTKWPFSLATLTALLRGQFALHTKKLTWTPTDLSARGLPYLEAGDWVQIATGAEDIPTVSIPYLDRTLSGIQSLTDDVTCNAGNTIEVQT